MQENQKSVFAWIHATFPEWAGVKGRALAVVEEAVELALAAGLSPEDLQSAVDLSVGQHNRRVEAGLPLEAIQGEVADVLLNVYALSEGAGFDANEVMTEKMEKNRAKPIEAYRAKTKLKRELGLKIPTCP